MKISNLLEMQTVASSPDINQTNSAPRFGRRNDVLEDDKENTSESTTSASIAPGSPTNMGTIKRGKGSIFSGITTSKPFYEEENVDENSYYHGNPMDEYFVLTVNGKSIGKFTDIDQATEYAIDYREEHKGQNVELKHYKQGRLINENLRKWFKEKWVRFGPDGKIRGSCARGDDSEGKPKCLPQSKAHSLGKKGRASAARRKRREDPNPERSGAAINVATKKKKTNEAKTPQEFMSQIQSSSPDIKELYKKYVNSKYYRPFKTTNDPTSQYHDWVDNFSQFITQEFKHLPNELTHEILNHLYDYIKLQHRNQLESKLTEFAPGDGTDGRWYTDDEIYDIVGEDWSDALDLSSPMFNISVYGERAKEALAQEAESWLRDRGYNVNVLDVKDKNDNMSWYISGVLDKLYESETGDVPIDQMSVQELAKYLGTDIKTVSNDIEKARELAHDKAKDMVGESMRAKSFEQKNCPECGGELVSEDMLNEKKDACYYKVKSRYKVWPSAYASGALVKCRKKGAKNWGTKSETITNEKPAIVEDDLSEDQLLARELQRELQLFKKAKNKDISQRPKNRELLDKPSYSNILEATNPTELTNFLYDRLIRLYPDVVKNYGHEVVADAISSVVEYAIKNDMSDKSDIRSLIRNVIQLLDRNLRNIEETIDGTINKEFYILKGPEAEQNKVIQLATQYGYNPVEVKNNTLIWKHSSGPVEIGQLTPGQATLRKKMTDTGSDLGKIQGSEQ